jgi:UDP:flavonoid glycosyltransferase YjiC (YdhE family)
MRVLLSTIGSRGDVQPLVALAMQLKALGQEARVCAPPDFREWVEGFGVPFVPIGPEVRSTAKASRPSAAAPPTLEQVRQMMAGTVTTQFATIPAAAEGCDVILGANALQVAAPSIAEFAHAQGAPSVESLTTGLRAALQSDVAARARGVAGGVRADGARLAAERLIRTLQSTS